MDIDFDREIDERETEVVDVELGLLGSELESIHTLEFKLIEYYSPWPEHHSLDLKLEILSTMIQKPGSYGHIKRLLDL